MKDHGSGGVGRKEEMGPFKERHVAFLRKLKDEELSEFGSLASDDERVAWVRAHPASVSRVPVTVTSPSEEKDETSAKLSKDEGNKAFQKGHFEKALHFYNQSHLKAPQSPDRREENSILRANRSAALYHLNEYRLALREVAASLSLGYPKQLLHKLKDREARCLLGLREEGSALRVFRETLTALDDADISSERRIKWQRDVQIMIALLNKNQTQTGGVSGKAVPHEDEEKKKERTVGGGWEVRRGEDVGRYVVATKDLPVGQIVLQESPHAALLLDSFAQTHCFNCFKRVRLAECCDRCSRVVFCSGDCRERAERHHRWECPILPSLWASGISVTCLLSLRMVSQAPLRTFTAATQESGSKEYRSVRELVSHTERRSRQDLLQRAHMAVFLCNALQAAGYFQDQGGEREVGGALLHHLEVTQFNCHEVSELVYQAGHLEAATSRFIGGAIYPTLALFNHSCNPSIVRYMKGTKVVARLIRNVKKGEEIGENYGPIFTQTKREERRNVLREGYWFECACQPCREDWPTLDDMDPGQLRFKCSNQECQSLILVPANTLQFAFPCQACQQLTNILKGLKSLQDTESLYRLGKALLDEGKVKEAIRKLEEVVSLLDETLLPPFRDYHLCQQGLRTCYLTLGNSYQS